MPADKDIVIAYEGYLIARAHGVAPHRLGEGKSLLDAYAVALGVHHFFANVEPISASLLVEKAMSALAKSEDASADADGG